MRVTLIISTLACGGAQRVMSLMANYWAQKEWQVTLLSLDDASSPPFFELDSRVHLRPLGIYSSSSSLTASVWNNLQRMVVLRSAIRESKPDVVISFLYLVNVLVFFATLGMGLPLIVSERNYPAKDTVPKVWDCMRRWIYPFVAGLVVQTERSKKWFSSRVEARTTVIPNPVLLASPEGKTPTELLPKRPAVVALGNFYPQKGLDLLLEAFARLKDKNPDWTLMILGEGPLRPELESLRTKLGLNSCVHLPGLVKNPYQILCQADLFVMSSRWEGWSMALAEAMSCGLPVIAADCPVGPREIIHDGIDGVLVPPEDPEALAEVMSRLMSDESERIRLASKAVEITDRFALDKVMSMWEELLNRVMCN